MVGDQGEPLLDRRLGQVVEADGRVAHVVEQRLQLVVEQRQPVLHAGIALSGADGLVERVLGRGRAERLQVFAAKALLRLAAERHLADRHQGEPLHDLAGALRLGIEGLDVLQRVAEEVEAHGRQAPRREQVEDAAADGEFAGFHDGAGALEAGEAQALDQLVHVDALAGRDGLERAADELARRQALQDGVDGGEDDGRPLARDRRQPGHGGHARGHDLGVGPDAVVGHRVPGGHLNDAHLRGEEGQPLGQRLQAAVVAGDVQQQRRGTRALRLAEPRQHQRRQPIRHSRQRLPHGVRPAPTTSRTAQLLSSAPKDGPLVVR